MEDRKHNKQGHGPRYGSIDGFVTPRLKQQPAARIATIRPVNLPPSRVLPTSQIPRIPSSQPSANIQSPPLNSNLAEPGLPWYQLPSQASPKKRKILSKKRLFLRSSLIVLALCTALGGYLGIKGLNTLDKVFHGNVISDVSAAFNSTPLKGESSGRVNILLAGDSSDDPNHAGAQLTDSILLLSIDTQNRTAFILSIPRDLWVNIPGLNSYQKINAANSVTNFSMSGYPSGGMGALQQVVQTQLGIPVDYYGLMDYGAFKDSVDAVGGVTINIQSTDPRGIYDPNTKVKLLNGAVTLDGQQALNLARARGDGYGSYGFPDSDFDRTGHQRQLFMAVAEKAKSLGVLTNPLKVSDLFGALGNNFQTNLSLQNVLRLIQVTKGINPSTLKSYSFSSTISATTPNPILKNYMDPGSGEEALIPSAGIGDYGQLQQYYQQLTSNNPVVKEAPSVVILNASNIVGLASKQRSIMAAKDFDVGAIADANNEYSGTMIIDNTKGAKPSSLKLLQQMYPGTTVSTSAGAGEASEGQAYSTDFIVILGQNWGSAKP